MALGKSIFIGAALLVSATLVASAQPQYQQPQYQAYPNNQVAVAPLPNPVSAIPPSWYYDPYTSGLGPCPQRYQADPPCRETIDPSYGQPSYWPR
jgi:hypothetical protein